MWIESALLTSFVNLCFCSFIDLGRLQWGFRLNGHSFGELYQESLISCTEQCFRRTRCLSVNYYRSLLLCQLNSQTLASEPNKGEQVKDAVYSDIATLKTKQTNGRSSHNCSIDSMYDPTSGTCVLSDCGGPPVVEHAKVQGGNILLRSSLLYICDEGYLSTEDIVITCTARGQWSNATAVCEKTCGIIFQEKDTGRRVCLNNEDCSIHVPGSVCLNLMCVCPENYDFVSCKCVKDCRSIYDHRNGKALADGVYTLSPDGVRVFNAYCDMTNGGWTFILKRTIAESFQAKYEKYKRMIGDLQRNHWLGLENMHTLMTESSDFKLEVVSSSYGIGYFHYHQVQIKGHDTFYRLVIQNSTYETSLSVSQVRLRALLYVNNTQFTAIDADRDVKPSGNCASSFGGFWYQYCCIICGFTHGRITMKKQGGGILQAQEVKIKVKRIPIK